jgi:hypothetical protein
MGQGGLLRTGKKFKAQTGQLLLSGRRHFKTIPPTQTPNFIVNLKSLNVEEITLYITSSFSPLTGVITAKYSDFRKLP